MPDIEDGEGPRITPPPDRNELSASPVQAFHTIRGNSVYYMPPDGPVLVEVQVPPNMKPGGPDPRQFSLGLYQAARPENTESVPDGTIESRKHNGFAWKVLRPSDRPHYLAFQTSLSLAASSETGSTSVAVLATPDDFAGPIWDGATSPEELTAFIESPRFTRDGALYGVVDCPKTNASTLAKSHSLLVKSRDD